MYLWHGHCRFRIDWELQDQFETGRRRDSVFRARRRIFLGLYPPAWTGRPLIGAHQTNARPMSAFGG
jgi:hypothetical protein